MITFLRFCFLFLSFLFVCLFVCCLGVCVVDVNILFFIVIVSLITIGIYKWTYTLHQKNIGTGPENVPLILHRDRVQ